MTAGCCRVEVGARIGSHLHHWCHRHYCCHCRFLPERVLHFLESYPFCGVLSQVQNCLLLPEVYTISMYYVPLLWCALWRLVHNSSETEACIILKLDKEQKTNKQTKKWWWWMLFPLACNLQALWGKKNTFPTCIFFSQLKTLAHMHQFHSVRPRISPQWLSQLR